MKKINALQLRQSLSKIISMLQRTGEPILLEKGRKPAAVLISLEDFKKRFVEKEADERRRAIGKRIHTLARTSFLKMSSEDLLRQLRYGED